MKTVKKTLDILEVFLNGAKEVSISELTQITGLNISTIHGILQELIQRGYITQKAKRGKYALGLKFLSFSGAINRIMAIEDIVNPYVIELNRQIDEDVNIAVINGYSAINIAIIHSTHKLRVVANEKIGTPLYCTGVGKILLSGMGDEELEKYLNAEKFKSYTPKTIIHKAKLKKAIQKIRREGISTDDEEYEPGVRNLAAPVLDYNGKVIAAIGVLAPSSRLTWKRINEIIPLVKSCALKISEAMGYQGNSEH